jgi:Uma2 family endonuclease
MSNDHAAKCAIGGLVVARRFRDVRRRCVSMPATIGRFSAGIAFACHTATMSRMAGTERTPSPRSAVKLTYDDFVLFPDDGKRHELIDGEHYVTPSPNPRHQRILRRLCLAIDNYLHANPIGEVFFAPLDVVISEFDVVEPDLLYLSRERAERVLTPQHVRGVPDLVAEIASKGTRRRDETIKRALYERAGVLEYWVVDPKIEVVRVYRKGADRFERHVELRLDAGDTVTTPVLPGLEISLDRIFQN